MKMNDVAVCFDCQRMGHGNIFSLEKQINIVYCADQLEQQGQGVTVNLILCL